MRFFSKFLAIILAFVIGFLSCIGVIAGAGYIAYNYLSIDLLNKYGASIDTKPYFDEDADVSVDSMTLKGLIDEIQKLSSLGDEVSFNFLKDRYGLRFSQEFLGLFPDRARDLPIATIFGSDGLHALLEAIDVSYVLKFAPEGLVSDPLVYALEDKTLAEVVDMKLGYLFEDVDVGYLLGVQYAKNESGEYELVPANPDKKTLKELIAPIKLGEVLADAQEGKLDVLEVIDRNLAEVTVSALTDSLNSVNLPTAFGPKTLGEIIEMGDDGRYAISTDKLTEGVTLGEIMGYTYNETDGHWYEKTDVEGEQGSKADAMVEPICNTLISKLLKPDSGKSAADVIMASYKDSDTKLGNIMGYRLEDNVWYLDDGTTGDARTKADSFFAPICNVSLSDILGSDSDKTAYDAIMDQFEACATKLGDMMGYVYDEVDGKWYVDDGAVGENRVAADALFAPLCDIMLYELINHPENKPAGDVFRDKFKESDTRLGDLMGYTKVPNPDHVPEDGSNVYIWYDGADEITGVGATIAEYTLDQVLDGGINTDDVIEDLTIAEVYGLKKGETIPVYIEGSSVDISADVQLNLWYDDEDERASAIISALAELNVSELDKKLDELTIASVLDLVEYNGEFYSWEIVEDAGGSYVVMTVDNSITAEFAGLDLDSLSNGGIEDRIEEIHIGKFLGYTQNEDGEWENSDGVVTGILGVVAGATTLTLEDKINKTSIGDIAGYIYVEDSLGNGAWYVEYESETVNVPASGILATLSDLTVDQLSDEEAIRIKVQEIKLCDVLGYTLDPATGEYYKLVGTEKEYADGVMSSIMGSVVGNVEEDINKTTIANIAGYYFNSADGKYYTDRELQNEAKGVLVSFADLTIGTLTEDGALSSRIQTITIADVFEYQQDPVSLKWYCTLDDGSRGEEVTGIMAAIADSQISNISDNIKNKQMGVLLGYTYEQRTDGAGNPISGEYYWADELGVEVHPLMNKVASTLFSDLDTLTDTLTVGDLILPEDRETGYISLIDEDTTLNDLPDALNEIFAEKTIAELYDAGIIELDPGTTLNPVIANLSINELINYSLSGH